MSSKITHDETNAILSTSDIDNNSLIPAQTQETNVTTVIGKSANIKGNLAAREDMVINGHLEGTIAIKNNCLEIGQTGHIEANIFAKTVIINGELKGDIYASEQATISKTARVYGNIFASDVNIEDGAQIKGNIDMAKQEISHHPLIPDFHDDEHSKAGSFSSLFKRMRGKHPDTLITSIETSACKTSIDEILLLASNVNLIEENSGNDISIIGETVMIKGEVMAEENMIILGQIEGIVHFKNANLLIGHNALIRSNIFTKSIITQGEINGDIFACEKAIIKKPGHISGNIHSPGISIESGAVLMGSIDMEVQDVETAYANAVRAPSTTTNHDKKLHQKPSFEAPALEYRTTSDSEDSSLVDTSWPKYLPRS